MPKILNRHILETVLLPQIALRPGLRRVLFVGCADYTHGYDDYFFDQAYYTIDVDPTKADFGAKKFHHHFVDSVENAGRYFGPFSLDTILINGVFGFGLDEMRCAESVVSTCYELLSSRGLLMIGWNDLAQCKPFDPMSLETLNQFDRMEFPSLCATPGVRRLAKGDYLVEDDYQHVFSFFQKK